MKKLLLICLLGVVISPASAEIYRQVDKQGQAVYSDTPSNVDEQPAELPKLNEIPSSEFQTPLSANTEPQEQVPLQYQLAIIAPDNNAVFSHDVSEISITVSVSPPLSHPNHYLQYYQNDLPIGALTKVTTWVIKDLLRGSHQFSVAVIEKDMTARGLQQNKQLSMSPPITVFQQRQYRRD